MRNFDNALGQSYSAFIGGLWLLVILFTPMAYKTADTSWLARCGFGIAVHWTAQSVPVAGEPLTFAAAVDVSSASW